MPFCLRTARATCSTRFQFSKQRMRLGPRFQSLEGAPRKGPIVHDEAHQHAHKQQIQQLQQQIKEEEEEERGQVWKRSTKRINFKHL